MGPNLQLWLPCLIVAHACAFFWLLRAYLLTQTSFYSKKHKSQLKDQELLLANRTDGAAPATNSGAEKAHSANQASEQNSSATLSDCQTSVLVPIGVAHLAVTWVTVEDGAVTCAGHIPAHLAAEGVTLEWQGVGCSYTVQGASKVVLRDVWGQAHPGQMQALIGPSGAGKSTLMDILAMRKSVGQLSGCLLVNGQPATASFIQHTSYVPQEDTFIPTMTCEETLSFYGNVTLGGTWTKAGRQQQVQVVLGAVGLTGCADTLVGGTLPGGISLRGLSGGERRRLSIAAGILAAPSVLFLDEPTSGLDSFAALSVMGHLQHVSRTTHQTVIATIHQPRNAIWEMFDTVSLLASGRLMFHGHCSDMVPWFQGLGYPYDNRGCQSDWVLDLVAIGFDKPDHLFGHSMRDVEDVNSAADRFSNRHVQVLDAAHTGLSDGKGSDAAADSKDWMASFKAAALASMHNPSIILKWKADAIRRTVAKSVKGSLRDFQSSLSYPTSWWAQFTALYGREMASMTRNPFDVAARIITASYVALLFGLMAHNADYGGLDGFNTRLGVLFTGALVMMLLPYVGISLYTADKEMYMSDCGAKLYRASAYYCAKVACTTPFTILSSIFYCGIFYGMSGLRAGGDHFAKYAVLISLLYMIAGQVLHLCSVVAPNFDTTFALSIIWTALQLLCSSMFIAFPRVHHSMQWLTQLRYISAAYFTMEGLVINEFKGDSIDCSGGLDAGLVDSLTSGLNNASPLQLAVLGQLKRPQPGCTFNQEVLVAPLGFFREFGVDAGALVGYLAALHALTFLALVMVARKERR